jgi:hypothetical protein
MPLLNAKRGQPQNNTIERGVLVTSIVEGNK